jgi:hypothetical protein
MAEETVAINLKVLSPSSEIEGGIHLQDLPASTTVKELRLKIQDAVASKPGPERMRLIYRGKVVANDADTLETVFGADNVGGRALRVICVWQLTRAPAPRIQRPKPASSTTRTATSSLDVVFARSTHRSRPAESIPSSPSTAPSKPSPDEPVPSHTTTSTKLAATGRATATPSPPPRASSSCPPSPSCAAAAQPARSRGRHPTATPDAAADCTSTSPARRSSAHASCRYADVDTADRRSCAQACVDRRSSRTSTERASTWIRGTASPEWQDGAARGHRAKWCALVRHIQRLHSKYSATAWTANHGTTGSIRCPTPTVRFACTRWSKRPSKLASAATTRNLTRSSP